MSKGKRAQYTLEFKMRSDMKRLLLGLMLLMTATAASAEEPVRSFVFEAYHDV